MAVCIVNIVLMVLALLFIVSGIFIAIEDVQIFDTIMLVVELHAA